MTEERRDEILEQIEYHRALRDDAIERYMDLETFINYYELLGDEQGHDWFTNGSTYYETDRQADFRDGVDITALQLEMVELAQIWNIEEYEIEALIDALSSDFESFEEYWSDVCERNSHDYFDDDDDEEIPF